MDADRERDFALGFVEKLRRTDAFSRLQRRVDPQRAPEAKARGSAPTVFVSWAHSNDAWSSAEAKAWQAEVADFSATLVQLGVDADVDLFHLDEPMDWTRFGPRRIQESDMTVVVISEAWSQRWSGDNDPRVGAGAAAEADTLKGLFARNQAEWQRRLAIVLFPGTADAVVPPDLDRVARLYVDLSEPDSVEAVVRLITGQPRYPKPSLGSLPTFGPDERFAGQGAQIREMRVRLLETRRKMRELKSSRSETARNQLRELSMRESALEGFIDALLKEDD